MIIWFFFFDLLMRCISLTCFLMFQSSYSWNKFYFIMMHYSSGILLDSNEDFLKRPLYSYVKLDCSFLFLHVWTQACIYMSNWSIVFLPFRIRNYAGLIPESTNLVFFQDQICSSLVEWTAMLSFSVLQTRLNN